MTYVTIHSFAEMNVLKRGREMPQWYGYVSTPFYLGHGNYSDSRDYDRAYGQKGTDASATTTISRPIPPMGDCIPRVGPVAEYMH